MINEVVSTMKKAAYLLYLCGLCLLFLGCKSATQPLPSETTPSTATTQPTQAQTAPSVTEAAPVFEESGKLRIPYTVNRSGVRYITDPSQLPAYDVFAQYGDTFFQEHALLLITETVASGSTDISIESIQTEGNTGTVVLAHTMTGEGTSDMATWLVWTVVDSGLDLQWSIKNPALPNSSEIQTS